MLLIAPVFARAGTSVPSDVTPPTAPTITATAISSSWITVVMTEDATDASGIASRNLERSPNGTDSWTELDDDAAFPYSNSGLSAETTYYYRSRATDNNGNVGDYSSVASATTEAVASTYRGAYLPQAPETFNTDYVEPTGNVWTATNNSSNNAAGSGAGNRTGCGLGYALSNCALGDVIYLTAGATYAGTFTLPNKGAGDDFIVIMTDALPGVGIPMPGTRVVPAADAAGMPTIQAPNVEAASVAIQAVDNGAHHYRFVGIHVVAPRYLFNLMYFSADTLENLPSYIWFDRCYVQGHSSLGSRRGVALDGRYMAVVDSHFDRFFEAGGDSQAVWVHEAPGPYRIHNNFLSGAGMSLMFGGAQSSFTGVSPSDIEVTNNHFWKDPAWEANSSLTVKNSFELKHAKRVKAWNNTLENNWGPDQAGYAAVFTPRVHGSIADWTIVCDVDFQYNKFINTTSGVNILGMDTDDAVNSQPTRRILVRNNYIYANGNAGHYRLLQISTTGDPSDIIVDHNTSILASVNSGTAIEFYSSGTLSRFVYTNNITYNGAYGVRGDDGSTAIAALAAYCDAPVFSNNAMVAGTSGHYPSGNFFPANVEAVGFENSGSGDYSLSSGSSYKGGGLDGDGSPDGTDLGVVNWSLVGMQ